MEKSTSQKKYNICYQKTVIKIIKKKITLLAIIIISTIFLTRPSNTKAQVMTPPTQDVTVSTTIKVPSDETPTPTPTLTPYPTTETQPTITISPPPTKTRPITEPTTPITTPPPTTQLTEEVKLIIFGYAPANTPVSLIGKNVLELTTSNLNGYFEFSDVPLPSITENLLFYPELCLQAYYKEVSTQPVCLPKIPVGQNKYKIGPVLISPILVIEKPEAVVGSQIKAMGKAIPNSHVFVYLAKEKSKDIINLINNFKIIQNVSAYYLPKYEIASDKNGNFEFNLPTESQARWRIFAAYSFYDQNSPKSNTLSYQVISPAYQFLSKILIYILNFIFESPITAFITFEALLILILIYLIFIKKEKKKTKKTTKDLLFKSN